MKIINYKIFFWYALVALLTLSLWQYGERVSFNSVTGIDLEPAIVLNFLFLVTVIALGYILFSDRWLASTVSLVSGFLFLLFMGFTGLNLIAFVLFLLMNLWAYRRAKNDLHGRMKINIWRTVSLALLPVVLGFFMMASFAAYQSDLAEEIKTSNQLPSRSEMFIREVVDKIFGSEFGSKNSNIREKAVEEISSGTFKSINEMLRPFFQWTPPLFAFGLFAILWGLSWIFVLVATWLAVMIFWLLKKSHFVKIEERDVRAEVIMV